MDSFEERDLWWESRQKSEGYKGNIFLRAYVAILKFLFPKQFGSLTALTFGTAQSLLCVDLNKYRPDVNVEMLIDQGIRMFMLRVIGPTRWVYNNWEYQVDPTFTPYYKRIRDYAKAKGVVVWIVGYGVHNPWANEEGNYQGLDPQVTLLKEATRNHLCDQYCWDDEVAKCWKNNMETTITGTNLVKSISIVMAQTFNEMEKHASGLPKMPIHYSANWFMKTYGPLQYQTWLDNADRDIMTRRLMTWRAWLPTIFSEYFALITSLFDKVITPTGLQENAYLRMGSELAADLWQVTFTAMGPWCGPISKSGCDASASYGPSATITQYAYNANLPLTDTPPPPPPPPPVGEYVTLEVFNKHTHGTGTPL